MTQFALSRCHRFVHYFKIKYLLKIRMASGTEFPLVFPHQEPLIGRMSGMTCSALAFEDRRMNNRPVEFRPFFGMTRAAKAVFGLYQTERAAAVGRTMAI